MLLALLLACEDRTADTAPAAPPASGGAPIVSVSPGSVDFGGVPLGDFAIDTVTVGNIGDEALEVRGVTLVDATVDDLTLSAIGSVLVPAGGSTTFNVTYTAWDAVNWTNTIEIETNDEVTPLFELPLSGTGLAPILALTPESADLGAIVVGCTATLTHTIVNTGTANLVISDFEVVTASTEFTFDSNEATYGPLPWTLAPGSSAEVDITYAPVDDYADELFLTVTSNDPYTPSAQAHISATGVFGEGCP